MIQKNLNIFKGFKEFGDYFEKGGLPIGTVKNGMRKVKDTGGKGDWVSETDYKDIVKHEAASTQKKLVIPVGTERGSMVKIANNGNIGDWVRKDAIRVEEIIVTEAEITQYEKNIIKPSVDQTWKAYEIYLNMVATGTAKGLVAFGTGGVGKTFLLEQSMENNGLKKFDTLDSDVNRPEEYDYVMAEASGGGGVYQTLFEHNGKTIVFDDTDMVLKDTTAVDFFKKALDSSGDGTLGYKPSQPLKTEQLNGCNYSPTGIPLVPTRFRFTGSIIFISNLPPEDVPQPLIDSRCLSVDLSMDKNETIVRLTQILPVLKVKDAKGKLLEGITMEEKQMALDFLSKHRHDIRAGKLNARTLGNIIKIIHATKGSSEWQDAALPLLTN